MKQTFTLLTKTLLLLCVLLAGSASAWGEDTFKKVTANSEITAGKQYVLVCESKNKAMAVYSSSSYCAGVDVTISDNTITAVSNINVLTLEAGENGWYFKQEDGKFLYSSAAKKLEASESSKTLCTITDEFQITMGSNGNLQYNASSPRFCPYTSNQTAAVLYIKDESSASNPKITLDENSLDFGDLIFGQTNSMTFTVTPANLTGNLAISCDNDKYEVSPTTIAQGTTTETTVTVTAKPTAKDDDMEGTVTISGGGIVSKYVALIANVVSREAVAPVGPAGGSSYSLVTDASTLKAGDVIIIANTDKGKALSTTQNSNNRDAVGITVNDDDTITPSENTQEIVLDGDVNAWYFRVGTDAYLYAASSSKNYLKTDTKSTVGDNGKAEITINENYDATILFQGTNTHNELRYNSSSTIFSCYVSTSETVKPQIYRRNVAASFDLTVGSTGWRTLVASVDATLPAGLKAYTVTASTNEKATLTEVTSVKANTAYLLNGKADKYTLSVAQTADQPSGNLLQVSTETTGNGVYVLANNDKGVGFYKWAGGSLGAGRVYLPAPTAPTQGAAREFIAFGISEQTAIEGVAASVLDGQYYDLQGRSVAQPRKGLYIVNGKKVVIK